MGNLKIDKNTHFLLLSTRMLPWKENCDKYLIQYSVFLAPPWQHTCGMAPGKENHGKYLTQIFHFFCPATAMK